MRRFIIACAMLAAFAVPRLAVAQTTHGDSPKANLHLSETMTVGTTILPPGDYVFQCRLIDDQHFLVVTAERDGKEITRVPCTSEDLPAKVTTSEFRSRTKPEGGKLLSSVRIKGETIAHRIVN